MKISLSKCLSFAFGIVIATLCAPALPDDIDLFANSAPSSGTSPNILIVLDNTSNWTRQNQHWPGGITQGQSEVKAIKESIAALGTQAAKLNVGVMEFPASGSGGNANGGQIRFAIKPLSGTNQSSFNTLMDTIYNNISDSKTERQNANLPYGNMMENAYRYFTGGSAQYPTGNPAAVIATGNADPAGYTDNTYTQYQAPAGSACGHNFIIFIGNPNASGPDSDPASNTTDLGALPYTPACSTTQPSSGLPRFAKGSVTSDLGSSANCYANSAAGATSCSSTEPAGAFLSACSQYGTCACAAGISTSNLSPCAAGTQRYSVIGTKTSIVGYTPNPPASPSCPSSSSSTTSGPGANQTTTTTTSWASCTDPSSGATTTGCGTNQHKFKILGNQTVASYVTTTTYAPTPVASASCPSTSTQTTGTNPSTTTTTSWSSCSGPASGATTTGCGTNQHKFEIVGTRSDTSTTTTTTTSTTANQDTGTQTSCGADSASTSSSTTNNADTNTQTSCLADSTSSSSSTTNNADTNTRTSCLADSASSSSSTTNNVDTGTTTSCIADVTTSNVDTGSTICDNKNRGGNSTTCPTPPAGTTWSSCTYGTETKNAAACTGAGGGNTSLYTIVAGTQVKSNPPASPACPSTTTTGTNPTTTTSWASCTDSAANQSTSGCAANQHKFEIFGNKTVTTTTYTATPPASATCPTSTTTGTNPTVTTSWASCSGGTPSATTGCSTNQHKYEIYGNKTVATTTYTENPPASATCPATTTTGTNPKVVTSWSSCSAASPSSTTSCSTNQHKFEIYGTKTVATTTTSAPVTTTTNNADTSTQTSCTNDTASTSNSTPTSTTNPGADTGTYTACTNDTPITSQTQTLLGNTVGCYSSAPTGTNCTSGYSSLTGGYNSVACSSPTTTNGTCPKLGPTDADQTVRYEVQGSNTGTAPTGAVGSLEGKSPENADLWTQCMRQNNIATTYTIDVYNAQPDNAESELYNAMALLGGGKYYAAQNEAAIKSALTQILNEIQSVNSTFASAALPINATNRAQNANQVFIGQFRPDPNSAPRWMGNLKRYKIIIGSSGTTDLGDQNGKQAIASTTGFIADCASSFWTTDSGTYWETVADDDPPPKGKCTSTTNSPWSDDPDGPLVEKGAVAEILRKGNTNGSTTNPAITRTMKTLTGTSTSPTAGTLATFNTSNTGLASDTVNFTIGQDIYGEANLGSPDLPLTATTNPRPSIHGDVIHSRPLPVNYSTAAATSYGVVVFYGANDGTYRAVDAETGKELWAFVPPEKLSKLARLKSNSPPVLYYGTTLGGSGPTPEKKDYFVDGSSGLYQTANNSAVWIYASMHRGGRMIYAFDVTNPNAPSFKWRAGCPDLSDDIGCTVDSNGINMSAIGQTWSLPNVGFIKGYSTGTAPVVVTGGGYDACEDANNATPSCTGEKGRVVYVLDGADGHVIRQFTTLKAVAADVSLVDITGDGLVDYAYAADTGGNLYRINFVDPSNNSALTDPNQWAINRIAYTGANRKFLFGPATLPATSSTVYLALGSGDREHPLISQYPTTTPVTNRFFVYLDTVTNNTATNLDSDPNFTNNTSASCATPPVLPGGTAKGYYRNLTDTGEQTVTAGLVIEGQVAFSTNTPTNPAAGACTSLGTARGYLMDLFSGSGSIGVSGTCGGAVSSIFTGGGLPPSPVVAFVPVTDSSGHTSTRVVAIGVAQKSGAGSSGLQGQDFTQAVVGPRKGIFWKKVGDN